MNHRSRRSGGEGNNVLIGLIFCFVGAIWLIKYLDLGFPSWVFSWKSILVIVGIFLGIRDGFRNITSFILIGVGFLFMLTDVFPDMRLHRIILPLAFIAGGLGLILQSKKKNPWFNVTTEQDSEIDPLVTEYQDPEIKTQSIPKQQGPAPAVTDSPENVLDIAAVFGNIKKVIISKNFKGGEIVAVFGGAEVNLVHADMRQPVVIEAVNIFGGTKLIIPSSWEIRSELVAIFGGVEDKRQFASTAIVPDKIITLQGFSMFGGIEIKSY